MVTLLAIEDRTPTGAPTKPKFLPSCHKTTVKHLLLVGGLPGPPITPYHGGSADQEVYFFKKIMFLPLPILFGIIFPFKFTF